MDKEFKLGHYLCAGVRRIALKYIVGATIRKRIPMNKCRVSAAAPSLLIQVRIPSAPFFQPHVFLRWRCWHG